MLRNYSDQDLAQLSPFEIGDALERGEIVQFPRNPIPLPSATDLVLLRDELPKQLNTKNVSYHPESDHVHGVPPQGELHDVAVAKLALASQAAAIDESSVGAGQVPDKELLVGLEELGVQSRYGAAGQRQRKARLAADPKWKGRQREGTRVLTLDGSSGQNPFLPS